MVQVQKAIEIYQSRQLTQTKLDKLFELVIEGAEIPPIAHIKTVACNMSNERFKVKFKDGMFHITIHNSVGYADWVDKLELTPHMFWFRFAQPFIA